MTMLGSITLLLLCQLAGEIIARLFGLPIPGPVIGMVILFIGLILVKRVPPALSATADSLLNNLSLLFIPAGVGIVVHIGLIAAEWPAVSAGLVIGTAVTMAVTGLIMQLMLRRKANDHE